MKVKIGTRLFLFAIGVAAISIITVVVAQRYTFMKGVRLLGKETVEQRIGDISKELARRYEQAGGWEFVQNRKNIPARFFLNLESDKGGVRSNPIARRAIDLVIYDKNRDWVAGTSQEKEEVVESELVANGRLIGYISLAISQPSLSRQELRFARRQFDSLLLVGLAVLGFAVIIAWLLARSMVKPIKQLSSATQKLELGNFDVELDVSRQDELGELGWRFNDLAEALRKAKADREQWVADISHELRTPLAALKAELEALEDGYRPITTDSIKSLSSEVQRLELLTDDLYQLTQSDSGTLSLNKEHLDMNQLIKEGLSQFCERFEERSLAVAYNGSKAICIYADENRLKQLFANLLENSLRYTDVGGRIEISHKVYDKTIQVIIKDSEPGVPTESLSMLFNRLYRVDPSRNRITGSSGLGLAICKGIVEAHQGTISADHSSLGGIQVKIELPIGEANK